MTTSPFEKLRKRAGAVLQGDLGLPWSVQTSNACLRIGTDQGNGDVLCAVIQQSDGHPDLHAAPRVLNYIVEAHPHKILQLIHERDAAQHALPSAESAKTPNENVTERSLCEASRVKLRPNQIYRFTVTPGCPLCETEARPVPTDRFEKLRDLALAASQGNLRLPWSVQTSNSFRRIGTDRGDGDVLCAVTKRTDGRPDLHAAPHVLDYIVEAQPLNILQLIRERDAACHNLHSAAGSKMAHVTEMRLCEAPRLVLHPNQLYRFTVAPGCLQCEEEAPS